MGHRHAPDEVESGRARQTLAGGQHSASGKCGGRSRRSENS
jgi:hypothetical protein